VGSKVVAEHHINCTSSLSVYSDGLWEILALLKMFATRLRRDNKFYDVTPEGTSVGPSTDEESLPMGKLGFHVLPALL